MKLGLHIAATDWAGGPRQLGSKLAEIVQATEAAGFDAISVVDHVWQSPYLDGPEKSEIEGYTTLGFIAAHTRRVRLLTLATCAAYRPAGLLGKMVTTLDVLSDGRMMLGIDAGDYAEEAAGLGLPFPKTGERFEIMEETVQACLRMWQGEHGSDEPFQGRHVRMERPDAETWTAALGVSDLQHGMPMRPDLHMRIGSITKSVLEASVSSSLWRSLFVVPHSAASILPHGSSNPLFGHLHLNRSVSSSSPPSAVWRGARRQSCTARYRAFFWPTITMSWRARVSAV